MIDSSSRKIRDRECVKLSKMGCGVAGSIRALQAAR